MANVFLQTANFNPASGMSNGSTVIDVTDRDIWQAAAEVGATSSIFNSPKRTLLEIAWRTNMALAHLKAVDDGWVQNCSYKRLDPSEKSGISYYLGMVLPAIIAKKELKIPHLVHVDSVLQILGKKRRNVQRPDLVGYRGGSNGNSRGRLLLEAKGRTNGFVQAPLDKASDQLKNTPSEVLQLVGGNALRIASLSYFEKFSNKSDKAVWQAFMTDPPGEPVRSCYRDNEYRALVDTAYCSPFLKIFNDASVDTQEKNNITTAWIPVANIKLSIPTIILEQFREIGLDEGIEVRTEVLKNVWDQIDSELLVVGNWMEGNPVGVEQIEQKYEL